METENTTETVIDRDRFIPSEVSIYRLSPLGFIGTTLLIFLVCYGSFVLIAELTGQPHMFETMDPDQSRSGRFSFVLGETRYVLEQVAWVGFVLSLILTAAFALAESGRRVSREMADEIAESLPDTGRADAEAFMSGAPASWRARYRAYFIGGAVGGLFFNVIMVLAIGTTPLQYMQSIGLWFLLFSPFLWGVGIRAGVDVSRESSEIQRLIAAHLEIDLFRLERLQVYGRLGVRGALSWAIMAAIILLFIADRQQIVIALVTIAMSIAGGLFIFISAVTPVHKLILSAKAAELDRVHAEMSACRDRALAGDAEASSALAGLTDYEQWIEKRPEWPISPTVTMRFALYVLIPLVPIIGSYVFERIADQIL